MLTQEDFTDEERYKMNVKMAVALIKHLHKEGKITDKAMDKIKKEAKKMVDNYR
jgi:adenylosuccinate lyase